MVVGRGDVDKAEAYIRGLTARRPPAAMTAEDRIRLSAGKLSRHPDALDILRASLAKVLAEPHCEKYRKVNVSSGPFKERVSSKTSAAVELLYAVGYEPMHGHLVLQSHEPRMLAMALEVLDEAKAAPTYVAGKAHMDGEKARQTARTHDAAAAAARRATYLAKVPAEPKADAATSACVITVRAPGGPAVGDTRRFDSDSTLQDLVHWIRSLESVPEADALTIENVTVRPARVLDSEREGQASLYALDLWPRGQVLVRVGVGA